MNAYFEPTDDNVMRSEYKKRVKAAQVAQEKAKKKVPCLLSACQPLHGPAHAQLHMASALPYSTCLCRPLSTLKSILPNLAACIAYRLRLQARTYRSQYVQCRHHAMHAGSRG